jgi:hypothetical protein
MSALADLNNRVRATAGDYTKGLPPPGEQLPHARAPRELIRKVGPRPLYYVDNHMVLQEGQGIASVPSPSVVGHMELLEATWTRKLANAFGLPTEKKHDLTADAVADDHRMRTTVTTERTAIKNFLEWLWREAYWEREKKQAVERVLTIDEQIEQKRTIGDVAEVVRLERKQKRIEKDARAFTIEFPKDPFIKQAPLEELMNLSMTGVLTSQEKVNTLRERFGFCRLPRGHPLIKQADKQLKNMAEMQTTEIQQAKVSMEHEKMDTKAIQKEMQQPFAKPKAKKSKK